MTLRPVQPPWGEGDETPGPVPRCVPNNALQLTASSVRSCLAPASGSS